MILPIKERVWILQCAQNQRKERFGMLRLTRSFTYCGQAREWNLIPSTSEAELISYQESHGTGGQIEVLV